MHDFFVSTTEIVYNEGEGQFEISIACAGHDVEAWFKKYDSKLHLDLDDEGKVKERLSVWISNQFHITTDGQEGKDVFLGYEIGIDDKLILYLTVPAKRPQHTISVTNRILTDLYPLQENIIHLNIFGRTMSGYCTRMHCPHEFILTKKK